MTPTWSRDLFVAVRTLLSRPGFSGTVILVLSLGIGATTALFGVFRAVFLQPVPLPDSDELVVVMETAGFGCCGPASVPDYLDWAERQRSFEGMAILNPGVRTLSGLPEPERVYSTAVSANAFDLLDVEPLLGRALVPEDEVDPSVVVLTHGLWERALGGRADVLGSTLEVDGRPHTVVGVMPPGFDIPSPWARTQGHEFFLPFPEALRDRPRGNHSFPVIARLRDGVGKDAAQQDMDRIMRELAVEYPGTNARRGVEVYTVHEYLYGDVGSQLALILGAAGLVLLIACANVAGLQIARATARETELCVRAALGASRRAIVRLLFTESLVLALLGGIGGALVSYVVADAFRGLLPSSIPRTDAIGIDGWALAFALGVSALTALAFGMVPALVAARRNLAAGVREGGSATAAPRKERFRDYFIVGQIALGLVLANGAAVLVQSWANLRGQDRGFDPRGVLTMALNAQGPRYETQLDRLAFYERVAERFRALPGVRSVGVVSKLPLAGGSNGNVWIEGTPPRASSDEGPLVEVSSVAGDYFEAMEIPLLRGRTLVPDDSLETGVGVVINETFAEEGWPGGDPLGKRFSFSDDPPTWHTVVGVVADVRQWGPEESPRSEAYYPFTRGWSSQAYLVIRSDGAPSALAGAARRAVLAEDPTQPPSSIRSMEDRVEAAFAQRRFYTTLIGLFAGAALLLAAAGVYGTVSYFVARRVRELGIRMALGADGTGIVGLVVRRGVRLAVWGVAAGLLGVWASTSLVESLVYGVGPTDPTTLVLGCALLAAVAVAASSLPAIRAIRVSPTLALRAD